MLFRSPGIVGRASLSFADGGAIPGVSIGGQVLFEVNTYIGPISVRTFKVNPTTGLLVRDAFDQIVLEDQLIGGVGDQDFDIRLVVKGTMDVGPLHFDGTFTFTFGFVPFVISASLDANLTLGSFGSVHVDGGFRIDSDGLALRLAASLNAGFGDALGLSFDVSGVVELNTTNVAKLVGSNTIQPGFFLAMHGSITFLGFASASGDITLRISNGTFELSFNVTLHLGPINVAAVGFAGIYGAASEPHKAIVLRLAVSIDVNVLDIIKINASGELRLNTTGIARNANGVSIGADSFRLSLSGSIRILEVIKLNASFDLVVGGGSVTLGQGVQRKTFDLGEGEWAFAFSASADFFGLATMSISGWIDSKGQFDIAVSGRLVLGSSSFGLVGEFSFRVYLFKEPLIHFHLDFSASVDARLFGISFASIGIDGSFDALQSAGQSKIDIIVRVTVRIKILFVKVSKTVSFKIGTIQIPPPIFLAGDAGGDPQNVGQINWDGSGDLYLNMGNRSSVNGLGGAAGSWSAAIS